jgi:hypothetical protein
MAGWCGAQSADQHHQGQRDLASAQTSVAGSAPATAPTAPDSSNGNADMTATY